MMFTCPGAEVFVPDAMVLPDALTRTTHMGIGAHQDDLEIMSLHGILHCFGTAREWFCGVTCTNGGGSPRDDLYADYTDEQMMVVRRKEQKKAAAIGEYAAQVLLDFSSAQVKNAAEPGPVVDLTKVLSVARPRVLYTHNLTDKHDTHVAVALRVIAALRSLPADACPEAVYGCEVWRDLDWLVGMDRVSLDVAAHENVSAALLGVFDSQICGGKRYDLAAEGRRRANATFAESHGVDETTAAVIAMDLTPLVADPSLEPAAFAQSLIERLSGDVMRRIAKVS